MDSSVSPTHGDQEGTAYNGHFGCSCYHPLFVFNQFGDLERSELRSGNVHSADGWRGVLEPVVERYRERDLRSSAGVSGSVVMPTSENHGRGVRLDEDEIDIPGAEAPASPSLLQGSPGGDEQSTRLRILRRLTVFRVPLYPLSQQLAPSATGRITPIAPRGRSRQASSIYGSVQD